jgi:putative membrane protein
MGLFKPVAITLLAIAALAWLLPSVNYANLPTLIIASIVLTLLQEFIRPVLKILFLPINIITLGLFSGVINVIILWLAIMLVPGFHIDQVFIWGMHLGRFWSLLFVSFLLSLIQSIISLVF